jgi:hypothetical protein
MAVWNKGCTLQAGGKGVLLINSGGWTDRHQSGRGLWGTLGRQACRPCASCCILSVTGLCWIKCAGKPGVEGTVQLQQ